MNETLAPIPGPVEQVGKGGGGPPRFFQIQYSGGSSNTQADQALEVLASPDFSTFRLHCFIIVWIQRGSFPITEGAIAPMPKRTLNFVFIPNS